MWTRRLTSQVRRPYGGFAGVRDAFSGAASELARAASFWSPTCHKGRS